MNISLSPFVPENLVSRDEFSHPVPRDPAHFPQHSGWVLLLYMNSFLALQTGRPGSSEVPCNL